MKMTQGVKSQVGGIAKGAVKQILQEPEEILKDVGEQVEPFGSTNQQQPTPQQNVEPSIEEQKKPRILEAHKREIEDEIARRRWKRAQKAQQEKMVEEQKMGEEKHEEEIKSESLFKRGLKLVTGRFKRRVETRLPKAA